MLGDSSLISGSYPKIFQRKRKHLNQKTVGEFCQGTSPENAQKIKTLSYSQMVSIGNLILNYVFCYVFNKGSVSSNISVNFY